MTSSGKDHPAKAESGEDITENGIVLPGGMDIETFAKKLTEATAHPTQENVLQLGRDLFESKHYFVGLQFLINAARQQDDLGVLSSVADLLMQYTSRYDIAIVVLKRILHLAPYLVPCWLYLARAYFFQGDLHKGIKIFGDTIRNFPNQRELACENVGSCLVELGYFKEAYKVFKIWLDIGGGETPLLAGNMACTLSRLNKLREAKKWYEKAMELIPGDESLNVGYGLNFFKMGQFAEGFPYYKKRAPRVMRKNAWFVKTPRLESLDDIKGRKVCLYHEQGLGDSLQFIRFLPVLLEKGAKVSLIVPSCLTRLFELSFPDVAFLSMDVTSRQAGHFDYALPIPDLPFVCGLKRESDIPQNLPYLRVDKKDVKRFEAKLPAKKPRIGLVWSGQNRYNPSEAMTDRRRSVNFKDFMGALTPIDATLISLQYGERQEDLGHWKGQEITDLMGDVHDMADTGAIIESLDLLISVDTSVVHLAGGLDSCPIWLISRWDSCWRWGEDGDRTPWYPQLKIFRPQTSDFKPVLRKIGQELSTWVKDFTA